MFERWKQYRQWKKEADAEIREKKREYEEKQKFLSSHADFNFLEKLIQKCNDNPDLRIDIYLLDGTVVKMKTYQETKKEVVTDWISDSLEIK
ncbi:MAG: hypothetical protein MJZ11_12780 [Lachnospiraceae bacterium]|nr:hypothetical protein [Lachnospiraceae bacterium]